MSCDRGLRLKPDGFFMYPCRAQKHTPRNNPRQRFGSKIGCVLGVSLLGRVKSGAFLGVSLLERVKSGVFLAHPCAEI